MHRKNAKRESGAGWNLYTVICLKKSVGSYDMIVSNPPYIPSKVIETLMPEVRDHEPIKALDGKEDGLYFYRRITEESVAYLKPGGYLLYEIGHDQAKPSVAI